MEGVLIGEAPTGRILSLATVSGFRTVAYAPVSMSAVTRCGADKETPSGAKAEINSLEGPTAIWMNGPEAAKSGRVLAYDGNQTPRLNDVKVKGTSASSICFTKNASLPIL